MQLNVDMLGFLVMSWVSAKVNGTLAVTVDVNNLLRYSQLTDQAFKP